MLHAYGNRMLALHDDDRRLLRVALDRREVRAVQRWTLLTPLLVAVPVGAGTALAFTWSAKEVDVALPATGLVLLEALLVAAASVAAGLVVQRVQRSWMSEPGGHRPAA